MRNLALSLLVGGCVPSLVTGDTGDTVDTACPENRWVRNMPPEGFEESPASEGFFVGDRLPKATLLDQFGEPVCIRQFYGKPVVIDFSPRWCPPCKDLACFVPDTVADYAEQGLVYLTVMPQGQSDPATVADAAWWAERAAIDQPVLIDPSHAWSADVDTGTYPVFLLLDEQMTIRDRFQTGSDAGVRRHIDDMLGLEVEHGEPLSTCKED